MPSSEFVSQQERRRLAYRLAAGSAVVAGASDASAVVEWSGPQDIVIEQYNSQNLDLDGDENQDITLKNYIFFGGNYQGATVIYSPGRLVGFSSGLSYASALQLDDPINDSTLGPAFLGSLAYGANNPNAEFNNASDAYIGFSFPIGGTTEDVLHYGWVRVSIDNAAGSFVIHDWAYEDEPLIGILAGDTGPEQPAGDFNQDGVVDTADYTVWRDSLNSETALPNDNDLGTPIGIDHYNLWRGQFGAGISSGSEVSPAAPEPGSLGLLAAGSAGLLAMRRRNRRVLHRGGRAPGTLDQVL